MTQHGLSKAGRVVSEYVVDTLGAPFTVTLVDSVSLFIDQATGKEMVDIPDVVGLIGAVVRSRVMHPRKLGGEDIKFVREAICVPAFKVARFLDMSPEHLSRCEAGAKVMSNNSEKLFRLASYTATFFEDPKAVFEGEPKSAPKKGVCIENEERKFIEMFVGMKIDPVFTTEPLKFEFSRRCSVGKKRPEYSLCDAA